MVLTPKQNKVVNTLQARQAAGTIKPVGLAKLNTLQAQQGKIGSMPSSFTSPAPTPKPAIPGAAKPPGAKPTPGWMGSSNLNADQAARANHLWEAKQAGPLTQKQQKRWNNMKGIATGTGAATKTTPEQIYQEAADTTNKVYDAIGNKALNLVNKGLGGDDGNILHLDTLPDAPATQDLAAERQRIEDSLYGKYTKDFGDEKNRQYEAKMQELYERGITPGSGKGFEQEMNRFDQDWNRRYDDARQNAISQGGAEWQRTFDIGQQGRASALGERVLDSQIGLTNLGMAADAVSAQAGIVDDRADKNFARKQAQRDLENQIKLAKAQGDIARANALAIQAQALSARGSGGGGGSDVPFPSTGLDASNYQG